jgi:membrane protein required for beta-lactamase induction
MFIPASVSKVGVQVGATTFSFTLILKQNLKLTEVTYFGHHSNCIKIIRIIICVYGLLHLIKSFLYCLYLLFHIKIMVKCWRKASAERTKGAYHGQEVQTEINSQSYV